MDSMTFIAVASIITAGFTTGVGCIGPALGEGRAVSTALGSLAPSSLTPPPPSPGHCSWAWR